MQFIVNRRPPEPVEVSLVLLDWSCRESFHILDYLAEQTVDRNRYEIIWTEFYDASPQLCERISTAQAASKPPPVDTYAVMGMDKAICYHKHLLMNLGIVLACGRIVCFADSDALVSPTFIQSIIETFERETDIVLHLDEVRNNDPRFYPFGYPTLVDIRGFGCINWVNGKPTGLADKTDPLHTRNYGTCMAATRSDMIAIGGVDMHIDYLGHIAGAYETTWRLVNSGKREFWHQDEYLYHVWHPGQAGDGDVIGPHDGMHIASRALQCRDSCRTMPFLENRAMAMLREGKGGTDPSTLLEALVDPEQTEAWQYTVLKTTVRRGPFGHPTRYFSGSDDGPAEARTPRAKSKPLFGHSFPRRLRWRLAPLMGSLVWRHFRVKLRSAMWIHRWGSGFGAWLRKPIGLVQFLKRILTYDRYLFRQCWLALAYAAQEGNTDLILYGEGSAARVLCALSKYLPVHIRAICPFRSGAPPQVLGRPTVSEAELANTTATVVVAAFVDTQRHLARLRELGIDREATITLQ